jgi:hypothetical protein
MSCISTTSKPRRMQFRDIERTDRTTGESRIVALSEVAVLQNLKHLVQNTIRAPFTEANRNNFVDP